MRTDIMLDIETLGKRKGSTIFQIAAVEFDIATGETFKELNLFLDINKTELQVDGDTLQWWLETDSQLLSKLLKQGDKTEKELCDSFYKWVKNFGDETFLWGNGINFDNNHIKYLLEKYNYKYPVKYNEDRDVRTILELASIKTGKSTKEIKESIAMSDRVKHDAVLDCHYQIKLVSCCHNKIIH